MWEHLYRMTSGFLYRGAGGGGGGGGGGGRIWLLTAGWLCVSGTHIVCIQNPVPLVPGCRVSSFSWVTLGATTALLR